MDLYKELGLRPVRSEPDVWVSRLVIFDRIVPDPIVIRDISLEPGLNIIWAEETEDDNPAAEISGHSAGKTTFCRFLRYVLGEKTFGTKANMELIRRSFPEGYVAAEVHVEREKWGVRRPFGSGRMSYAKRNATIEELLQGRGESVTQDEYPQKIGLESLLDKFETGAVVRTGEAIQWGHILAWCTRDQEARFQNIYDWRSRRSESDTPTFRFSKGGALFVMRTALGLFFPDELKGEEELAALQRERDRVEKDIEEKRREPQFRVNIYDQDLRRRLKALVPAEQHIDTMPLHSANLLPDLHRLTESAIAGIEQAREDQGREREHLQNQIDQIGAQIQQRESDLEELNILFDLNIATGKELDALVLDRQARRQQLKAYEEKMCPFGGVLIRECNYVVDRQGILQITQYQDARAMEQAEAKRENEKQKIERAKVDLREAIQKLGQGRHALQARRDSIDTELSKKGEELRDLAKTREALQAWTESSEQESSYPELKLLRERVDEISRQSERLEGDLTKLLQQHDRNRQLLASIFSAAVRSVLSSGSYDGKVLLDNRQLAFLITHGPAMSGEAVETLSVLLSDVASLVYDSVSDSAHLPGLMMHDSPREADLGIRIYRSFIRFLASLVDPFSENENCPFQYILTTTTPPPTELQESRSLRLRLNASDPDTMLLRRNIAELRDDQATLFGSTN